MVFQADINIVEDVLEESIKEMEPEEIIFANGIFVYKYSLGDYPAITFVYETDGYRVQLFVDYFFDTDWYHENKKLVYAIAKTLNHGSSNH